MRDFNLHCSVFFSSLYPLLAMFFKWVGNTSPRNAAKSGDKMLVFQKETWAPGILPLLLSVFGDLVACRHKRKLTLLECGSLMLFHLFKKNFFDK
jgi:hypothetical protein